MHEGMELLTSFVSPRWLNTKSLSFVNGGPNKFPPILILVKTEGLDSLLSFSLQNIENLGVMSFLILQNTKGHCCDVDGCNQLSTIEFKLDVLLAPSSVPSLTS